MSARGSGDSEDEDEQGERARRIAEVRAAAKASGIGRRAEEDDYGPRSVDVEDDDAVYITKAWRDWERHYLKKLAQTVHRMVCAELDRFEESIFMLFVNFDGHFDGAVAGREANKLLQAIEEAAPGVYSDPDELIGKDGSISFISLLDYYGGSVGKEASLTFTISSLAVGLVGSGSLANDARLEALSWDELRRNIVGYRRLLSDVRQFKEDRSLEDAREIGKSIGFDDALLAYYEALSREFEGDAEHLFELFCEVDESGNMLLESEEVVELLRLLDTAATEDDLTRYMDEINLDDGPLSFSSLLDWWDQARSVPNSLVAEKGAALIASVKARAAQRRMSSYLISGSSVQAQRTRAKDENRSKALCQSYARTISEIRDYKMERDLRNAEVECSRL